MKALLLSILALAFALLSGPEAWAQSDDGAAALDRLAASGEIACGATDVPTAWQDIVCDRVLRVGLRDDYPGFAVRRAGRSEPEGFEVDLARLLARRLGLTLKIETVTPVTRLPALSDGDVDLVIATMGHNTQRDRRARFLRTHYYSSETVLVGRAPLAVTGWADLRGRTICSTSGNYANAQLSKVAGQLMLFRNIGQLHDALETGTCPLIAQDDGLLAAWLDDPAFAAQFERKLSLIPVHWGAAMPLTTPAPLARVFEAEIETLHRDGTLIALAQAHKLPTDFLQHQSERWQSAACRADATACQAPPLEVYRPLRVQLMDRHQPRYSGFYAADATGLYGEAGLDVHLLEGEADSHSLASLIAGKSDVALAWMGDALAFRAQGHDILNIAQFYRTPSATLICRRDSGIATLEDLAGKRLAVRNTGDERNLALFLAAQNIAPGKVSLVQQTDLVTDLLSGNSDCVTALSQGDFRTVLGAGFNGGSLRTFRLADAADALPEDGLYVRRESLKDPARRQAIAQFLAATVAGWRLAREKPEEVALMGRMLSPDLDDLEQRAILQEVLTHLGEGSELGLLDLSAVEGVEQLAGADAANSADLAPLLGPAALAGLWTHDIWYDAGLSHDNLLRPRASTLHFIEQTVSTRWFYVLDILGCLAAGIAGFLRARTREFDLWGALILTMLPAIGGGTLRDLLIGGERSPPFVFQDPNYMFLIFAVLLAGTLATRIAPDFKPRTAVFDRLMDLADTIGLSAFTVIGTKVALVAGLEWFWAPFFAAVTSAGGGMLSDIVAGREPRTFRGEPYEELAVLGSLLMLLLLEVADRFEGVSWLVSAVLFVTLAFVFTLRLLVIHYGLRSPRLRGAEPTKT
ncbi:ABC transporter substrate-binding protein [Pseudodonghicola flavimaris]|uniref:ABC transporter substrate-binding protein n=1 Tax=Pseudodonghicola flavimaris TaxID=3050036 RepID=A0ABT7F2X6_9RHOB|nr:transporter substrate-binding domain-containing protein [Pseudodonghicola flavimaris]MDK3018943.1 ABC transporter substrate-binding protein [Pseudodonghicola flavimaris]